MHLREISNMIHELQIVGHILTNEQQVQSVILSLSSSCENMKIQIAHNEIILTFDDISCRLELEEELINAIWSLK